MFCRKCGGKLKPEADFCGSCGSAASTLSRPVPPAPAPESLEKPTWLKVIFVIWAFAYSAVGAFIVIFLLMSFVGLSLGYEEASWWLADNSLFISAIVGLGNALTRGVAAARRI